MNLSDIELSKEDFTASDYETVIIQCEEKKCKRYRMPFLRGAEKAKSIEDTKNYAIFTILSAITSLHLDLELKNEAFSNIENIDGISNKILDILIDWAPEISDAELQARVADVLWAKKRKHQMAQLAVDSYLKSAEVLEHPEHWPSCVKRIERAKILASQLNYHVDKVFTHIEAVLEKYNGEDPLFLSARLMEFLQDLKKGDPQKYAALAEKAAINKESQDQPHWYLIRNYWEIKVRWHQLDKDEDNKRIAWLHLCETYVKQAEGAVARNNYVEASGHLDKAIQAFRRTSNTQERVEEVRKILREYQTKAVEQMHSFSESIDSSKMVRLAREEVKGKPFLEAIFSLAKLGISPKVDYLRQQVLEDSQKYILKDLFSAVVINEKGQVQARQPPINSNNPEEKEKAIKADMQQHANLYRSVHAQACIETARYQINLEHNARLNDWLPIVSNNILVPPNREIIFAKGFHAGLIGDFLTSSHFLIPQIEHSIRNILIQKNVITTHISDSGIENEYALSKTLYMDEVKEVLGEDITFDLQGLLVDKFGSNLRNLNCHGLIDYTGFFSPHHIYLWWLVLRLCCLPIIALNQNQAVED